MDIPTVDLNLRLHISNFQSDQKREVRAYLQASGLGYTFVHVGLWYQATFPPSPKLYTPSTAPPYFAFVYNVYGSGDVKSAVVDLNHIGMIVTRIIQDEATINQKIFACEDEITLNRAWALAQHYSGDERLREWKKTVSRFTFCRSDFLVML